MFDRERETDIKTGRKRERDWMDYLRAKEKKLSVWKITKKTNAYSLHLRLYTAAYVFQQNN